ncbi:hypothetical protein VTO73DRAFT_8790 [Trametes versicolor]
MHVRTRSSYCHSDSFPFGKLTSKVHGFTEWSFQIALLNLLTLRLLAHLGHPWARRIPKKEFYWTLYFPCFRFFEDATTRVSNRG